MNKKDKIKKLLDRVDMLEAFDGNSFAQQSAQESLTEITKKVTQSAMVRYISDIQNKLEELKSNLPNNEKLNQFENDLANVRSSLQNNIDSIKSEIASIAEKTIKSLKSLKDDTTVKDILISLKELKNYSEGNNSAVSKSIDGIQTRITQNERSIQTISDSLDKKIVDVSSKTSELLKNAASDIKDVFSNDLQKVKTELTTRINSKGGGNINRQIKVDGIDALTTYNDINLISGNNIALSVSKDTTNKLTKITIAATGGASGVTGSGTSGQVTYWNGTSTVTGSTSHLWDETNKQLSVGTATGFTATTNTPISIGGSSNSYFQVYNQNTSTGTSASSDFIVGADNDGVALVGHYSDMGIQGSNWSPAANPTFNGFNANEGYFVTSGGNVGYGTDSSAIKWFVGGFTTANEQMRLTTTGLGFLTTAPTNTITLGSTSTGIMLFNTSDQTTNYERSKFAYNTNVLEIGNEYGGTGTQRALRLGVATSAGGAIASGRVITITPGSAPFINISIGTTTIAGNVLQTSGTFTGSSTAQVGFAIAPTINQTSTAGFTGLLVQPTYTAVGSTGAVNINSVATIEQLRLSYDASNYLSFTVASTGATSMVITGSSKVLTLTSTTLVAPANLQTNATNTSSNFASIGSGTGLSSGLTTSQLLFAGATTILTRNLMRGSSGGTITAAASYSTFVIGENQATIAASGTHGLFAQQVIKPLLITAGAGTLTNSASLYIEGAATGATNNYAIWSASGLNRFDGHMVVEGVTSTGATGTGKFVFDTSPTLVTPTLGVATATTINKVTLTAPATGSTLTIADGKTFTVNQTMTADQVNESSYTGTITWTGTTAPSGSTNNTYRWVQIGNAVYLNVTLGYSVAGTGLTAVTFDLPSGAPTPDQPAGFTAASDIIYQGSGRLATSTSATPNTSSRSFMRRDSGNTKYEIVVSAASGAYAVGSADIVYFTA